jgi:hypothetical protein
MKRIQDEEIDLEFMLHIDSEDEDKEKEIED